MNNKVKLIICLILILLIGSLYILKKENKKITCVNESDGLNTKILINYKKKITNISYKYIYIYKEGQMEDAVDKYDSIKSFVDLLTNIEGVSANVDQEYLNVFYNLDVDFEVLKKEYYDLLNIQDLLFLKNKQDIINYYNEQNFTCN